MALRLSQWESAHRGTLQEEESRWQKNEDAQQYDVAPNR